MELGEYVVTPAVSVTLSITLYVPGDSNSMLLPETTAFEVALPS